MQIPQYIITRLPQILVLPKVEESLGVICGCYTRKDGGFDITTIPPSKFKEDPPKYTITPLAKAISNSHALDTDLSQLFQEQRLSLIHIKYFGVPKHDGEDEFPDATPQKVSVCLLITDNLKRPILVKTKYHILAYKLYFGIFANGFFKYTGYSKFTLLNQKLKGYQEQDEDNLSTELIAYVYNRESISSIKAALQNKDTIFNSMFNMTVVHKICKSYDLGSAHQISVLPGIKSVRILGVKKTAVPSTEPKKSSYLERILSNSNIIREGQRPLVNGVNTFFCKLEMSSLVRD
ncbi:hypothetical protein CU098_006842, partial [Rhizopus stolonifer]